MARSYTYGMDIKKLFGSNLRHYRKKRHLSQEQLSELVNITAKHLCAIENGMNFVSAGLLEKLADTLDVSVSSLFYSPDEQSGSESFLTRIDPIIDEELETAMKNIKIRIRS
jgi:transcriptional regulator with XRE-family HTH domain